jgi:hypothetical protein
MSTSNCESGDTYLPVVWRGSVELSCSVGLVFLPVRGARGKFLHADLRFSARSPLEMHFLTGACNFDKQRV